MQQGYFFIATPLQYLCALEAKIFYKKNIERSSLIILNDFKPILLQLNNIIIKNNWDEIIYFPKFNVSNNILNHLLKSIILKFFLLKIIKNIKNEDYVFIGNINQTKFQWILNKINVKNKIIIDDGLGTITYFKKNKINNGIKKGKEIVDSFIFQSKRFTEQRITFFSIYHPFHNESDQIIENKFKNVKKIYGKRHYGTTPVIYFIGQHLVNLKIIDFKTYVGVINSVKKYYEKYGISFEYYAHRTENCSFYPDSWNIRNLDQPIEIYLLKQKVLPSNIATFYSSAAINIKRLFSNKIKVQVIRLPKDKVNPKIKSSLKFIYEYFEHELDESFEVTSFNEFSPLDMHPPDAL